MPEVDPVSLSQADVVIVAQSVDGFFNPDCADAMRAVVDELESLNQVESILWLDRVPVLNIFGLPQPLLLGSTASQKLFEAAKKKPSVIRWSAANC